MADPLIELYEASVVLGGARILESLTLTIRAGEHTAVLGPNGAGKSTLMKLLSLEVYPAVECQIHPPIRLFGRDRWDVSELRARIGIVSADVHDRFVHGNSSGSISASDAVVSGFFGTLGIFDHQTVADAMREAAARALDRMGIAHLSRATLDTLSTGEARRVLIARALVREPRLLVLDEPTRGLDLVARHQFMERVRTIASGATTLLLVTHYVDEIVPEIERVVLLDRGRLIADGPKDSVLTAGALGSLFGAQLALEKHAGYFAARVEEPGPRG